MNMNNIVFFINQSQLLFFWLISHSGKTCCYFFDNGRTYTDTPTHKYDQMNQQQNIDEDLEERIEI